LISTSTPAVEVHLTAAELDASLARDVAEGLGRRPRQLPPKWLYDEVGSRLFDDITRLPEYYPTRAERAILAAHSGEIAEVSGAATLVELGSGTSEKTRLLLDALDRAGTLECFVGFDVAEATLRDALAELRERYPRVRLGGVVGDFERHLEHLPRLPRRMVAFLGGTIGNLERAPRRNFLETLAAQLEVGDWLLLGTDLVKDVDRLVAAYDDAAGVTAAFERNVLAVVNRNLEADFDLSCFEYVARWDEVQRHVAMGLRSRGAQRVRIGRLGLTLDLDDGEEIATETSAKFTTEQVAAELTEAGFALVRTWLDPAGDFAVHLAARLEL